MANCKSHATILCASISHLFSRAMLQRVSRGKPRSRGVEEDITPMVAGDSYMQKKVESLV